MLSRLSLLTAAAIFAACSSGGANLAPGRRAIARYGCGSCHVIPEIPGANGQTGPALAGIRHRNYLAGQLTNDFGHVTEWIRHPHSFNPKTAMPELGVTPEDAQDIAVYLYAMK